MGLAHVVTGNIASLLLGLSNNNNLKFVNYLMHVKFNVVPNLTYIYDLRQSVGDIYVYIAQLADCSAQCALLSPLTVHIFLSTVRIAQHSAHRNCEKWASGQ